MAESLLDPWAISPSVLPRPAGPRELLPLLVRYAVLAPSTHNTQPWLFQLTGETLELYADRSRSLPVIDPEGRELTISCGAALFHLRLAARSFGYREVVETFPSPGNPDLLARFTLPAQEEVTPEDQALFLAILQRRTNRLTFEDRPVPDTLLAELQTAAVEEGAWCYFVRGRAERDVVAELAAEGARRQLADKAHRRELAAWMRPNESGRRDGVPGYALGLGRLMALLAPPLIRAFNLGEGQAEQDRQRILEAPALAVLGTKADTPRAWLAAGQALARLLLCSRGAGVWASCFNQTVEVPDLRVRLSNVVGWHGYPQLLFRLGYGSEVRPTPRRPTQEVLRGSEAT